MARFSTAAGVPKSAGALARSSTTPMPIQSTVRTLAALNSQGPSSFASSIGRSMLSTTSANNARANAKKLTARGNVASASAPGDAAAFLKNEGLSEADIAAISAKYPQISTAGVDTVSAKMSVGIIERDTREKTRRGKRTTKTILFFFSTISTSTSLFPSFRPFHQHSRRSSAPRSPSSRTRRASPTRPDSARSSRHSLAPSYQLRSTGTSSPRSRSSPRGRPRAVWECAGRRWPASRRRGRSC